MREQLIGKTTEEKVSLKAEEIVRVTEKKQYERKDVKLEIVDTAKTQGGVEVFARAWRDGQQIGFGKDGTVDIERFRWINPSIEVLDPNGDIVYEYLDDDGSILTIRKREDPQEALLQRLEAVLEVKKEVHDDSKIISEKRGNTTTVVDFTQADSHTLAQDGIGTYAGAHDATTGSVQEMPSAANNILHNSFLGSYFVRRSEFQFDTSAISSGDTISAASVTMYINGSGGANTNSDTVVLLDDTNNGNLQDPLASEDFNDFTTTSIGSRVLSELTNIGANRSIDLTDFTAINKGGETRIGLRLLNDINNTTPTGGNLLRVAVNSDFPFLTVEHAAGGGVTPRQRHTLLTLGVG